MEIFEFIRANPNVIKDLENCKIQSDLHKVIIENKIDLKGISEAELFNIIVKVQKENEIVEDEMLENVAGGMSNAKQRKIQNYSKEKADPSVIKGNLGEGITFEQCLKNCSENGDNFENYYEDKSSGLYYRLN